MSNKQKGNLSVLLGAAFLMATSSCGPGFITQTASFTNTLGADFAFVILASVVMAYIAQLNVWRVIAVSGLRGQDIANKVLPGLGYFVALLVAFGGLAFNIANIGGAGLGLNVAIGIDTRLGSVIGGVLGILIFSSKSAGKVVDKIAQALGACMIILMAYVASISSPPVAEAASRAIHPENFNATVPAILTILGGTVGGYIVFSGGHRLLDAGIKGEENLSEVNKSATLGIGVALIIRILLFLAVLGVVSSGAQLDPENVAASAFKFAAGEAGYRLFGVMYTVAAMTATIGAAFTSISFLKTLFKPIRDHERAATVIFITISTVITVLVGKPQTLLIFVGALNALILPITLTVLLIASKKPAIVGNYKHSNVLFILGWVVVLVSAYMGVTGFITIAKDMFGAGAVAML